MAHYSRCTSGDLLPNEIPRDEIVHFILFHPQRVFGGLDQWLVFYSYFKSDDRSSPGAHDIEKDK